MGLHVGWRARFLGERPQLAAPLESDFFYSFLAGKKKGAQLMLKIRSERTLFTQKKRLLVQCISVYVCVWNLSATLPLTFFATRTQCDIFTNFVSSKYFTRIDSK